MIAFDGTQPMFRQVAAEQIALDQRDPAPSAAAAVAAPSPAGPAPTTTRS